MGFKRRPAKTAKGEPDAPEFRHSSGANSLEEVLGEHTLAEEADVTAPKGYRARSIAKTEKRKAG
jgi:hypothetical protein